MPIPKDKQGELDSGECYLVYSAVPVPNSENVEKHIHFWLGKQKPLLIIYPKRNILVYLKFCKFQVFIQDIKQSKIVTHYPGLISKNSY